MNGPLIRLDRRAVAQIDADLTQMKRLLDHALRRATVGDGWNQHDVQIAAERLAALATSIHKNASDLKSAAGPAHLVQTG